MSVRERMTALSVNALQGRRILAAFAAFSLAVGAFFVLLLKSSQTVSSPVLTPKAFGEALYASGAYAQSAQTLRANYQLSPTLENQLALMTALYASGGYESVLELALSDHPDVRAVRLLKSEALIRLHRYADARTLALRLLSQDAADAEALFVLARCDYALGDFASADKYLQSVIRAQTRLAPEAWMLRARMALDGGDDALALSAAERAEEAGADQQRASVIAIEAMIRSGRRNEAQAALSRRATLMSAHGRFDPYGLYLSGLLSLATNDIAKAARTFNVIEPWLRYEIRGPLILAAVNWRAGDRAQAKDLLEQYLVNAPDDWVSLDLHSVFTTHEQNVEAMNRAVAALRARRFWLGEFRAFQLHIEMKDYDAALDIITDWGAVSDSQLLQTSEQFLFGDWAGDVASKKTLLNALTFYSGTDENRAGLQLKGKQYAPLGKMLAARSRYYDGDLGQARMLLDEALFEAPEFEAALSLRVLTDIQAGRIDQATLWLTGLVAESNATVHMRLLLARLHMVRADYKAGVDLLQPFEAALLKEPDAALFYAGLLKATGADGSLVLFSDLARSLGAETSLTAHLVEKSGRFEKAALLSRSALLAMPEDEGRVRDYGRIMEKIGRVREAISLLKRIAARRSDQAGILEELVRLQGAEGDKLGRRLSLDRLEQIDEARAMRIRRPPIKEELEEADAREALSLARRAYRNAPENGEVAFQYGVLRARAGEDATAIFQIACFWGAQEACGEEAASDS